MAKISLKAGDIITFTNKVGHKVSIKVSRVDEKSWYDDFGRRNAYGTLEKYAATYPDFKISR